MKLGNTVNELAGRNVWNGIEGGMDIGCLDACRAKRNSAEYGRAGVATKADADELIAFSKELRESVIAWLEQNLPHG